MSSPARKLHRHLPGPPPPLREGYARADDGTLLYFNLTGPSQEPREDEPLPLVMTDGIACDQYIWRYMVGRFSRERRCVRWNLRGHGRSGTPAVRAGVGIYQTVEDLRCLMDELGIERAVLAGHSMGVQVTLEFYRRYPQRVAGLVLLCGAPGRPVDTFQDSDVLARAFPYVFRAFTSNPDLFGALWRFALPTKLAVWVASRGQVNLNMMRLDEFREYLEHAAQLDVDLFIRMLDSARVHDATSMLDTVKVPALVAVAENDVFTPVRRGLELWEGIPDADLLAIPGAGHAAPVELPELVNLRLAKFLAQRVDQRPYSTR